MKDKNDSFHKPILTDQETDFLILSAKALGWYRNQHKNVFTLKKIGDYTGLSPSTISKYLIAPKGAEKFNTPEDLDNSSKTFLSLHYALQFAKAMDSNLWDILHLYNTYINDSSESIKLNEEHCLKNEDNTVSPYNEHLLTDVNDPLFRPWLGEFYCYFSSTSSSEINKEKKENDSDLTAFQQELFDIIPSKDHLFCGKMCISKSSNNLCQVSLIFMSDKTTHNIKHYYGTLSLSRLCSAGFISLYCQENGEGSYIIIKSPDSTSLKCRMAMALTLSSIDGHRRACAEKMLITEKPIQENSKAYDALKAFLPMNDSIIRITNKEYDLLLEELKNSEYTQLQEFANDYNSLSSLISSNSTIEAYNCALIPESTIDNWKFLESASRDILRILMRKHSISNWYYKANNKNAEEILYIIEEKAL